MKQKTHNVFARSEIPIKFNLATKLTILRILCVPLLAVFLIRGDAGTSLLIFIVAALSDGVDGFVARTFNQRTHFGAILDPLSDKLLLITCYSIIPFVNFPIGLNYWVAVTVIFRDIIILAGAVLLYIYTDRIYSNPSSIGKITTFFQLLALFGALLASYLIGRGHARELFVTLSKAMAIVVVMLTVVSGVNYIVYGLKTLIIHNEHGGGTK